MPDHPSIDLSIVAPAHDEAENLPTVVAEIDAAIEPLRIPYEIIIVDDASHDDTPAVLAALCTARPHLIALRLEPRRDGRPHGQSAAFAAAFRAARGGIIASLDADRQNDPADLPALLQTLQRTGVDMVQGDRTGDRRDGAIRKLSSTVGRCARRLLLADSIRDTGCSLRVMRAEVARALPLDYAGMHRFIPVMARQLGHQVLEMPVHHRPRVAGRTSYGILNRAVPGLIDCVAVRWMRRRRRAPVVTPVEAATHVDPPRPDVAVVEIDARPPAAARDSAPAREPVR